MASVGLIQPIITLGLHESMTRFFPAKNKDEIRDDFYSSITVIAIVAVIISFIIFYFPKPLANAIFEGNILVVKILAGIIIVRSLHYVLLVVFRAFREMKKYGLIRTLTRYVEVGLVVILVLSNFGLIGALLAVLSVRLSFMLILAYLINKKIPFCFPTFSSLKEYLSFGLPMIPGFMSKWAVQTSDKYIIGFFLGSTFVGYYAPGYSIGWIVPGLLGGILGFVLPPAISHHYENNEISMINKIFNLSNKYFLLISIPYFVGVIIIGHPILEFFTTSSIADQGYIILVFISLAGILFASYKIFMTILFVMNKTKYYTFAFGLSAGVNIIGNIILVPIIGILGAGIMTVICYLLNLILMIYWALNVKDFELSINRLKIPVVKIIFSSIIMGCIVYYLYNFLLINFLILVGVGMIIYFVILFMIGGINRKEIDYLKKTMISR